MFQSATLKLTTWYLSILVVISLLFSIIIYSIAAGEVNTRIGSFQRYSPIGLIVNQSRFNDLRDIQVHEAQSNLLTSLVITNVCIWFIGGIGSYYLAKRTLHPIQEAHEAQSRFTSDASHELRTPLASMKTELEVALRDPFLSEKEMRELLKSNLEEVDKLTRLSHMLLQLSQLDHHNIILEKVSIGTITRSVIERYDKDNKRVKLEDIQTHNVLANKSSVEELITILLDNALKYSPKNSAVKIRTINEKQLSGFTITNLGEGIKPEILPHIFDRFFRADTSRTGGEKKGYGLGLSLAKKIVELHNGELSVSSAPHHETTFRVLLPQFKRDQAKNQK